MARRLAFILVMMTTLVAQGLDAMSAMDCDQGQATCVTLSDTCDHPAADDNGQCAQCDGATCLAWAVSMHGWSRVEQAAHLRYQANLGLTAPRSDPASLYRPPRFSV